MALGKISSFIVAILIVALVVGVFSVFLSEMNQGYEGASPISEEDLRVFNKLDTLASNAKEIQNQVSVVTDKDNPFDIIGNYFSAAWGSVKLAGNTVDVVAGNNGSIIDSAVDQVDLGVSGEIIKGVLVTIVIVLVVIGILLSALVKRGL